MGGSVGTSGGHRSGVRYRPRAEINVTPFVDVMLVLLIIFMITAPLLTVGVEVELPDTEAQALSADQEPLTISVQAGGAVFLQETEVALDELAPRLMAVAEAGYRERIYLRGDQTVEYGQIMKVMARLNAAGFTNIGLVTDPIEE